MKSHSTNEIRPLGMRRELVRSLLPLMFLAAVTALGTTARAAEPKAARAEAQKAVERILKIYAEGFRTRDAQMLTSPEMYYTNDGDPVNHYVLFDIMPSLSKEDPLVDVGTKNLLEKNTKYVALSKGATIVHWTDQHVDGDGNFAFFRGILNASLTYNDGRHFDTKLRHTLVLKKFNGKYLIIHEHVSTPNTEIDMDASPPKTGN